jgi:hypothetical protein
VVSAQGDQLAEDVYIVVQGRRGEVNGMSIEYRRFRVLRKCVMGLWKDEYVVTLMWFRESSTASQQQHITQETHEVLKFLFHSISVRLHLDSIRNNLAPRCETLHRAQVKILQS